ncbi:MAG: YiaA/YiaB family inner membrane protein [Anderseniella sp.]|uniref:YiaA/YiaB family inner membrane protein n=1 Tax=Parasphingorhabdus sp. TaxID=2709688 RepID=UPI003277AFAD
MIDQATNNSHAWNQFNLVSFVIAAVMMAGGIFFMDAGFAAKGFYSMSALMLVHTSISATKTLRDNQEAKRMVNKIEDAKTEKLLMDINK